MTQKFPPYFEKYFEGKFDEVNQNIEEIKKVVEANSVRITCIENWKAEIMGRVAIVSIFLVLAFNLFLDWIRQKLNI
jgi:hypothetical protein